MTSIGIDVNTKRIAVAATGLDPKDGLRIYEMPGEEWDNRVAQIPRVMASFSRDFAYLGTQQRVRIELPSFGPGKSSDTGKVFLATGTVYGWFLAQGYKPRLIPVPTWHKDLRLALESDGLKTKQDVADELARRRPQYATTIMAQKRVWQSDLWDALGIAIGGD